MKTFKELREAVKDVSSMGDREIASIANNPKHPMHSAAKAEHDRRQMKESIEEKTLTPAEKKKREEIATAIKRDNPDMPMDKKMAIATAQAKKVAEGKAYGPTGVSYYVPSGHKDEVDPKTGKKYPERQKPEYKNPSEQKVDEISMSKMQRYGKAAAKDIEKHRGTVKTALDQPASPKKADAGLKAMGTLRKRSKGSDMYVDKMTGRSKVKPTMEEKDTHVTKDGRTVKKGLWYYMNKRKKAGTSRPKSAGTVDPKMMKKSQE